MENKSFMQSPNFNMDTPLDDNKPFKPSNNLPLAIVATIVGICSPCCIGLILGIIAIVFSTQVDTKYGYGDYLGAESSAKTTKILSFISIGLFALNLIWTIIQLSTTGVDVYLEQYQQILEQLEQLQ